MAVVPLFWNTNMAGVTSCENALFPLSPSPNYSWIKAKDKGNQ